MIDWDRVNELKAEVGDESFAEVIALFLDEVDGTLARMRATASSENYRADLHFVKGSALNLGFRDLGALCNDGRDVLASGEIQREAHLEELRRVYERSKREFLAAGVTP